MHFSLKVSLTPGGGFFRYAIVRMDRAVRRFLKRQCYGFDSTGNLPGGEVAKIL
jgi:hypothetical protein